MADSTHSPTDLHRHPVRGFFWAIPLGLGVVLVLVVTKVIELDLVPMIVVFAVVLVLGTLWGAYGPARAPKGPAPTSHHRPPPPEVSRFDDFTESTPTETPMPAPPAAPPSDGPSTPDDDAT